MWTNLDELYRFANTPLFKNDWIAAKENAANFTFVGNRPWDPQLRKLNTIKKSQFDGSKYLVNITEINRPLNDETFVITTTDTKKSTSDALASSINFGSNKNLNLKIYGEPVLFTKEKSEFKFNYIWIGFSCCILISFNNANGQLWLIRFSKRYLNGTIHIFNITNVYSFKRRVFTI
ncbi:hypothetical protein HYE36_06975 [Mycoplasmopsis bovis]|nr:hypothetical protein [Mycoplasmopsis bovis]WHL49828.1 hypothetical protein HYE36_06975 [Mycoplasmopsis bovis]